MRPDYGETLVPDDQRKGLLHPVQTLAEVESLEAKNIEKAMLSIARQGWSVENLLDPDWLLQLHAIMYEDVWEWGGQVRDINTRPGIDFWEIRSQLRELCLDCDLWIQTQMPADELLAMYHHRLTWIHPFRNGNGRWARLATECLAESLQLTIHFEDVIRDGKKRYINALTAADCHDYLELFSIFQGMIQSV